MNHRRERMPGYTPPVTLIRLIEPHYPKAGRGRQPIGLEKMLRIYFLQQWFDLSDPAAEDAVYDSESMRRFAKVDFTDRDVKLHAGDVRIIVELLWRSFRRTRSPRVGHFKRL